MSRYLWQRSWSLILTLSYTRGRPLHPCLPLSCPNIGWVQSTFTSSGSTFTSQCMTGTSSECLVSVPTYAIKGPKCWYEHNMNNARNKLHNSMTGLHIWSVRSTDSRTNLGTIGPQMGLNLDLIKPFMSHRVSVANTDQSKLPSTHQRGATSLGNQLENVTNFFFCCWYWLTLPLLTAMNILLMIVTSRLRSLCSILA